MTVHSIAVEVVRLALEELQPPGTEYAATMRPPWLVALLANPALVARVEEEVAAIGREGMRIVREIERAAAVPASKAQPQLGLFGGTTR